VVVVAGVAGVELLRLVALGALGHSVRFIGQDVPGKMGGQAQGSERLDSRRSGYSHASGEQQDQ